MIDQLPGFREPSDVGRPSSVAVYRAALHGERYIPGLLEAVRERADGESVLRTVERMLVAEAMYHGDYILAEAARLLGVSERTMHYRVNSEWPALAVGRGAVVPYLRKEYARPRRFRCSK